MRALLAKVLTGSMIASAAMAVRAGEEMAVFHHPCGKREVTNPGAKRRSCPDCERLFLATTPARNTSQIGEG